LIFFVCGVFLCLFKVFVWGGHYTHTQN
jgi:hypothetical protein